MLLSLLLGNVYDDGDDDDVYRYCILLKVCNGSKEEPYTNPCAPVHITTGSAGCQEDHDPFEKDYPPWTAYRSEDYGYTRMTIFNETHLFMDQVSVDKEGEVIDKVWIIKESHGPEAWTAKQ
ncbi:Acid phosphatase type 7 [Porites harrisoni]